LHFSFNHHNDLLDEVERICLVLYHLSDKALVIFCKICL